MKAPNIPKCRCGSVGLIFTRISGSTHAGKFECTNCGAFHQWVSKEFTEFLCRIYGMACGENEAMPIMIDGEG